MPRAPLLCIRDMLAAIERVQEYTASVAKADLSEDIMRLDAVIRNLEVIGEASRGVSEETRSAHPEIAWREIAGLRDVLIHHYFGIDHGHYLGCRRHRTASPQRSALKTT